MMLSARTTHTVFQNFAFSPLGAIKQAAYVKGSKGCGRPIPRKLQNYALVYSLGGEASYWDERIGRRRMQPGDLFFILPNIAHQYGAELGQTWDEYFIVFEGPVFDLWCDIDLISPEKPILHVEPVAYWLRRLEACLDTHGATGQAGTLRQVCQLQSLLAEILCVADGSTQPQPHWLESACNALSDGSMRPMDLPKLARSLGISFETFRKKFTQIMGIPPSQYRAARTIDRACSLLLESDILGKEIALRLGFTDEYHFSKRFKQITGLSPIQFRRQNSGQARITRS